MDFGKIFGSSFRYPLNSTLFLIFFLFNFATTFPTVVLIMLTGSYTISMPQLGNLILSMLPFCISSFLVNIFLAGFFIHNASIYFKSGNHGKIKNSFETAKKVYLPLLGTRILFLVCMALTMLFFTFVFVLPSLATNFSSLIILPGFMLGGTAMAAVAFFLFLSPAACVLDKNSPLKSLKKSFKLIFANKADTFAFVLVMLVIVTGINFFGSIPSIIYSYASLNPFYVFNMSNFLFLILQILFGTYVGLFSYSAQSSFYLSLKSKKK